MNRYGVSSHLAPSRVAKPAPRQHIGGKSFTRFRGHEQIRETVHKDCGYEGPAKWTISDFQESFVCEGCHELVVTWDDSPDEPLRVVAHTDDDRLDGDPESFGPRGIAS